MDKTNEYGGNTDQCKYKYGANTDQCKYKQKIPIQRWTNTNKYEGKSSISIRTHCWTQIPWTLLTLLTVDRLTLSQIDLLPMSLDEDKKHAKTVKFRQKKTKLRKQKTSKTLKRDKASIT